MREYDPDTEARNEWRANIGESVVLAGAEQTGVDSQEMIDTAISDVLAYIAHTCDRFGLDPEGMFQRALHSYDGDFEDGPGAATVVDGRTLTLEDWDGGRGY